MGFWLVYDSKPGFVPGGACSGAPAFLDVLVPVRILAAVLQWKSPAGPLLLQSGAWLFSKALFLSSEMKLENPILKSLQFYSDFLVGGSKITEKSQ